MMPCELVTCIIFWNKSRAFGVSAKAAFLGIIVLCRLDIDIRFVNGCIIRGGLLTVDNLLYENV